MCSNEIQIDEECVSMQTISEVIYVGSRIAIWCRLLQYAESCSP
jgi:hypothetical protein